MRRPMVTYRHPRESGGPYVPGLNRGRLRDSPRERLPVEFASTDARFTLAPRRPGGEGRVRGADEPVCGAAHLTLPGTVAPGPLPLPPEGRRGAFSRTPTGSRQHDRLSKAVVLQPLSVPRTALRSKGNRG